MNDLLNVFIGCCWSCILMPIEIALSVLIPANKRKTVLLLWCIRYVSELLKVLVLYCSVTYILGIFWMKMHDSANSHIHRYMNKKSMYLEKAKEELMLAMFWRMAHFEQDHVQYVPHFPWDFKFNLKISSHGTNMGSMYLMLEKELIMECTIIC